MSGDAIGREGEDPVSSRAPEVVPEPPVPQKHHRDVQGGVARASVFGANDGLVSNVSLILGVAGATTAPEFIRLAGLAGLVAGAVSMAAGEYISMKAQKELFERELALEKEQLQRFPAKEAVELALIYQSRGIDPDVAQAMVQSVMGDLERALETHAREELGISPGSLGSPIGAALGSFLAFSVGAFIPLIPWLVGGGEGAVVASVVMAVVSAAAIGVALAAFTGRSLLFSAVRQVLIASGAAAFTYLVGSAIGLEGAP